MDVTTQAVNGAVIAKLNGRFDALEAPKLTSWIEKVTERTPHIVLNMDGVNFIDSTALSALVKGMKRCRQLQGDLVICGLQKQVRVIFELTRLDKALSIYGDELQALQSLN
jgi:anti-sigma B factor antagonist